MKSLFGLDLPTMFTPTVPMAELFVRGTLMYLGIFALLRAFMHREGTLTLPDLLVVVLIADAGQNAMAGDYRSITDGAILVVTIVMWSYLLDRLAFHFPASNALCIRHRCRWCATDA